MQQIPPKDEQRHEVCTLSKDAWILTWISVRHVKTREEQKHKDEMGLRLRINNKRKMKSGLF